MNPLSQIVLHSRCIARKLLRHQPGVAFHVAGILRALHVQN